MAAARGAAFTAKQLGLSPDSIRFLYKYNCSSHLRTQGALHRRRNRKKRTQRSSLLFGGLTWMTHYPFSSNDDLKKSFLEYINFGMVVVWCGVNQMIIHFSAASILPWVRSSFHPFLQIILVLNLKCGMELSEFRPPNSSYDLLPSLLSVSSSMHAVQYTLYSRVGRKVELVN